MRSGPTTFSDPLLLEGDQSRVTARRSGVKYVNHVESTPDIARDAYRLAVQDAGVASAVIGCLWLAVYVIAVLYALAA
jgi:hypothetical protein